MQSKNYWLNTCICIKDKNENALFIQSKSFDFITWKHIQLYLKKLWKANRKFSRFDKQDKEHDGWT